MSRRVDANAEFVECRSCGNHAAQVYRDKRDRRSGWRCHGCNATGGFFPDGTPSLLTRPAPARQE